jgi:hypothetical protein
VTNESTLEMRTKKRHDSVAGQSEWLNGETLEMVRLYSGHFLALIANQPAAPHAPIGDLPKCKSKEPKWPLPTELVSGNEFLADEWVYDPAIHGRILATEPDSDAVRCANHMIAGRTRAFLALTSRRLAVAIDHGDIEQPGDGESGIGKLLGRFTKAKDTGGQVADHDDGKPAQDADEKLATWWETARPKVYKVFYGRVHSDIRPFSAFQFADGSILEIRDPG